jgi:hypothetical protein
MAQVQHTPQAALLEEAITTLFCQIDDAYRILNPRGDLYASLKRLSDSEILALALFQQLRGCNPNAPSCARPPASSPTSSRGSSASIPPRSTAACAGSQAIPRTPQACRPARIGGRSGDPDRGFHSAGGSPSAPGP